MIYTVTLNPALDRELTVPAIEFDAVLRASEVRIDFGGKGFNVSRMLHSLGASSIALGFAGGRTGETLADGLAALGIGTDFVPIAGETRTNVSIVSEQQDHHLKVNEAGAACSHEEQAALRERIRQRARAGDWWVLAGSLPPGVPPDFYAGLIADIQNAGGRVVLDTSGEALKHGCAAGPFLAKPNSLEASQLTGLPVNTPQEAIAAAMALPHVQHLAISMGKDGALLVHGARGWIAAPPSIRERNPIGAGDSMVAGLVYALERELPLPEVLSWGIACGAATASRPGTTVGTREDVAGLLPRVEVREIRPDGA